MPVSEGYLEFEDEFAVEEFEDEFEEFEDDFEDLSEQDSVCGRCDAVFSVVGEIHVSFCPNCGVEFADE
jgi:ribosomal protein S27AE